MPSAYAILWFLAAFVVLWAISLVWRGLLGDRAGGRRRCPECRCDVPDTAGLCCPGCGFEAGKEREFRSARRNWRMVGGGLTMFAIGGGVGMAGYQVHGWTHPSAADVSLPVTIWSSLAAAIVAFSTAWLVWAIRGERSRGQRRCPKCWYDMRGGKLQCPECGHAVANVRGLYRPRRKWGAALVGVLLLLVAACVQGVPRVRAGGWRAAVPTTVAIAGMTRLPGALIYEPDASMEEDWTLAGRIEGDRVWDWQRRWVAWRTERLLRSARGSALKRASVFVDTIEKPRSVARAAYVRAANELVSEAQADRLNAVESMDALIAAAEVRAQDRPLPGIAELAPGLIRVVTDPNENLAVVEAAAHLLADCGSEAAAAVPRLIEMIQNSGRARSLGLAFALNSILRVAPEARGKVLKAIEGDSPPGAESLIFALTLRRSVDSVTAERLLAILIDGSDPMAQAAATGLARGGWDSKAVIPVLLDQLDTTRANRGTYLDRLSYYDEECLPYLPRIVGALDDPAADVRAAAITLLRQLHTRSDFRLDRSAAFPVLMRLSNDPDPDVARAAREALGEAAATPPAETP